MKRMLRGDVMATGIHNTYVIADTNARKRNGWTGWWVRVRTNGEVGYSIYLVCKVSR